MRTLLTYFSTIEILEIRFEIMKSCFLKLKKHRQKNADYQV